jgi:1,2-diacylglycerol 3-alpha-glucosyltransferase
LEAEGLARYIEFVPRGEEYYQMAAACDIIVLPTIDETQSGTLARVIAAHCPYITAAPMEGLTTQTLDSEGGLLFTSKKMLKDKLVRLACDAELRETFRLNLKRYLQATVSWEIVARQYNEAYRLARESKINGGYTRLSASK